MIGVTEAGSATDLTGNQTSATTKGTDTASGQKRVKGARMTTRRRLTTRPEAAAMGAAETPTETKSANATTKMLETSK